MGGEFRRRMETCICMAELLCCPSETITSLIGYAKSLQSCPILCDPIDGSPPDSPVPGILQARTPEWVAISFSKAWKCKVKVKPLSRVRLLATPWTAAYQAPPSMGSSRQEYWSGVPLQEDRRRHWIMVPQQTFHTSGMGKTRGWTGVFAI